MELEMENESPVAGCLPSGNMTRGDALTTEVLTPVGVPTLFVSLFQMRCIFHRT